MDAEGDYREGRASRVREEEEESMARKSHITVLWGKLLCEVHR